VLVNGFGILKLRRWNPSGEPIIQREKPADENVQSRLAALGLAGTSKEYEQMLPSAYASTQEDEDKNRAAAHAAPGEVRHVWPNPILWREIRTLAYGRRPVLVKVAYFVALALLVLFAFAQLGAPGGRPAFAAAYGLVPLGVLSLVLIAARPSPPSPPSATAAPSTCCWSPTCPRRSSSSASCSASSTT
jgi:hypothetical protein